LFDGFSAGGGGRQIGGCAMGVQCDKIGSHGVFLFS
jgi:hypothetical protein